VLELLDKFLVFFLFFSHFLSQFLLLLLVLSYQLSVLRLKFSHILDLAGGQCVFVPFRDEFLD
jgi:hypothetical protein